MTQTLDRIKLLRTYFKNTSSAFFRLPVASVAFFSSFFLVNAHDYL